METRLIEVKNELQKSYNHNRKKLYPLLKGLTEDEKNIVLADENVMNKLLKIEDYDIISLIFRMSPAPIQETIWKSSERQKNLLGIKALDIQNTKALNTSLYFSKERLRNLELFINEIKSPNIFASLAENIYFQIIVLFSKGFPRKILDTIDCLTLYENTIASGIYDLANNNHKQRWTSLLNGFFEEVKLPQDFHTIYQTTMKKGRNYYSTEDNSVIPMLRSKSYHLRENGKQMKISKETLGRLDLKELIGLYNISTSYNITDEKSDILINKDAIEEYFKELINKEIANGTIFNSSYLDLTLITHPFEYFVFTTLREASKTDQELETKLITFLRNYLFKGEYTIEEQEMINSYIKNGLLNATKEDLSKLFNNPNDLKSIFHMRFNKTSLYMNYLNGIEISQILKLNVKQINKIAKMLEDKTQDEISDIYSKAIRMYLVFGLDRTISILRGDYGKVGKSFLDCVSKLEVKDVAFSKNGKKYEPILNQEFINFLFTGDNIFKVLEAGSVFETTWFHLFNDFEDIKDKCKGHITIKQVEVILKEKTNKVKYDVSPDLYKLEDYLYEIGLGNKTKHPNEEIYEETTKIYREQLKRKTSTIPYVRGTLENGYSYEVMRLDDCLAYILGYKAGCCMRVLDIGHNHLLHALHSVNGRILLTYKDTGALASFSPLKRNGELLIANSIEVIGDKTDTLIAKAFQAGIEAIISASKAKETDRPLKVACIGQASYLKPSSTPWPTNLKTPTILEKEDKIYSSTDCYHKRLDIIYQEFQTDLRTLTYGPVDDIYKDPRRPIKSLKITEEISLDKIKLEKLIKAINYQKNSDSSKTRFCMFSLNYMEYAFYNDDWYILIDKNGKFYYECLDGDNEALKEMKATLSVISEITKKKDLDEYVLSFKKS